MARLTQQDIKALNACTLALHTHHDLATFPVYALQTLRQVIPVEHLSYVEIDPRTLQSTLVVLDPADLIFPESHRIFATYIHEHPVARRVLKTGDFQALKISDFLTQRQFHGLALYNEFYRRLGTEYQISIALPVPLPRMTPIVFNRRHRDFSERDRLCLNLLCPHLYYAYRNARTFTQLRQDASRLGKELEELERGVIVLEADGRIRAMTGQAWDWLIEYFDIPPRQSLRLSEEFQRWVRSQQSRLKQAEEIPPPSKPLCKDRDGRRLVVRFLRDRSRRQYLILEEKRTAYVPELLEEPLGLSRREAEVLFWVACGKTDRDVADLLAVSLRTVQKHLEHIYPKLGVDNRTAAANRALEILGIPDQ
jgi:DNA-binding CsgD family transcriptional regulator